MKLSSLALFAWMLLGQIAVADDTPGLVPLPPNTRLSPAAQRAGEAPAWNQTGAPSPINVGPATNVAPTTNTAPSTNTAPTTPAPGAFPPASTVPNAAVAPPSSAQATATLPRNVPTPAVAPPPRTLPISDDAKPLVPASADNSNDLSENPDITPDQPRPLHSVMIHRAPKAAAPIPIEPTTAVAPAGYEEPLPTPPTRSPAMAPYNEPSMQRATPPAASAPIETPLDPEKVAAARAAADLIATSFESRAENMVPITLLETITQASESARAGAIQDYWRLWSAWGDYHWAEDEKKRLEEVVPARGSVDSPMLSTARAASVARVHEAKANIQAAQDALMRSAHLSIQNDTYRPSDPPLVGPYHTYFGVLFANRQPPGRTLQIDRTLPLRLKAINDRAAALQAASSAIHYAEEAHAKGEADMRTVLSCHEELYKQRRALLDEVLRYNLDIGDYVTTVAAPGTPNEKLIAMLIEGKQTEQTPAASSEATNSSNPNKRVNATSTTRSGTSDGWVPSTMRTLDSAPQTQSAPPRYNSPTPANRYGTPTVGDRYLDSAR